jgi:hypothetical protein
VHPGCLGAERRKVELARLTGSGLKKLAKVLV